MNRRLAKTSLLNLLDHGVKFVAVFLVTPALAQGLGDHLYGVWLLVMAFFAYYTFLDAGMGLAGVRFLAREMGRKGEGRLGDVVVTCRALFRKIALVSVGLTVLGIIGAALLVGDKALGQQVMVVLAVCGVGMAVRFWLMIGLVLLKSRVDYGPIVWASIGRTIIQAGLTLWCLSQGWGIVALALVLGLCDVVQHLVVAWAARREPIPDGQWEPALRKELWGYSMKSFVARLGINLKDRIDPFVVGAVAGTVAVPQLAVGSRFLGIARDLVNALFGGQFLASFSKTEEESGRAKVRDDLMEALRLSASVSALLGLGMAMFGPVFIERWMGPEFRSAGEVLLVLVIPYGLFLMQYPAFGMLFGVDEHGAVGRAAWAGSAINLILSVVLGLQFGLMGVVWATAIDLGLIYGLVFPCLVTRAVSVSMRRYLGVLLRGSGVVLVPGILYWAFMRPWLRPDYGVIALLGLGLIIVIGLVGWGTGSWKRVDRK